MAFDLAVSSYKAQTTKYMTFYNQMTNGPVNADLISGPSKSSKHTNPK